jgi:starch-binding outer membrane protein, SusD/RagB family
LVRNRANLVSLTGLTKAEFSLALERERRVEFYCEGHRWHDLVRTGRAQAVINNYWAEKGLGFSLQTHEVLMPIPSREINIDPNLKQNPGY